MPTVGLATDGDADRLGVVDEGGRFVHDSRSVRPALLLPAGGPWESRASGAVDHHDEHDRQAGKGIRCARCSTRPWVSSTLGPVMMREDALTAGEESGGYAFRGNIPERDGILSGLMILDLMVRTGRSVSELLSVLRETVGPHFYDRLDLHFDAAERETIERRVGSARPLQLAGRRVEDVDTRDGYRFVLPDGYWALIRFSGTEPLLRIYAEGDSPDMVQTLLAEARSLAGA